MGKRTAWHVMAICLVCLVAIAQETEPGSGENAPGAPVAAAVEETCFVPTAAVLDFSARGRQVENNGDGKAVAELLFVNLLETGCIDLVERADLDKALDELHLSEIGMITTESQVKLGQLVGAKLLITGSVFESGSKKYAVAKIIGTETSRVRGCSVSGTGNFVDLVPELARKIQLILENETQKLLSRKATIFSIGDKLASVKGKGRKVHLKVSENIQASATENSSATALRKLLLALDFQITETRDEADFSVETFAIASSTGQYHKFTGAAARVEMNLCDVKNNTLLASGACTETLAGATYQIAAKEAIQQATLKLAASILKSCP